MDIVGNKNSVTRDEIESFPVTSKLMPHIPVAASGTVTSLGSILHNDDVPEACMPCVFYPKGRCRRLDLCLYCHFDHDEHKAKRFRKSKKTRQRQAKNLKELLHSMCLTDDDDDSSPPEQAYEQGIFKPPPKQVAPPSAYPMKVAPMTCLPQQDVYAALGLEPALPYRKTMPGLPPAHQVGYGYNNGPDYGVPHTPARTGNTGQIFKPLFFGDPCPIDVGPPIGLRHFESPWTKKVF
jgi:hypothetical protein